MTENGGMANLGGARCAHCGAPTMSVSLDAGAGRELPLFLRLETPTPIGTRPVRMLRQALRGRLCMNCGLVDASLQLAPDDVEELRRDAGLPTRRDDDTTRANARTRIKR